MLYGGNKKSYLHHILPPLSVSVIVGSIIFVLLLHVDAALAAFLPDQR